MKNKKKLIMGTVLTVTVLVAFVAILSAANTVPVNVSFADMILLEVKPYTYDGVERKSFTVEIGQDDIVNLKKVFTGTAMKDSPACPFGDVSLTFSSGEKSLVLYPAGDDCTTVRVVRNGEKYYFHNKDNELMREILIRYGVVWPHSI